MADHSRAALRQALAALDQARAAVAAALGEGGHDRFVPVAEAALLLRIEYEAARKRARTSGEKLNGRWGFRESYIHRFVANRFSQNFPAFSQDGG